MPRGKIMRSSAVIFLCSQQLRNLAKAAEKGLEQEGAGRTQWALHAPPRLPAWPRVGEAWRSELLPRFLPVWHSLPSVFSFTPLTAAPPPHPRGSRTPSESGGPQGPPRARSELGLGVGDLARACGAEGRSEPRTGGGGTLGLRPRGRRRRANGPGTSQARSRTGGARAAAEPWTAAGPSAAPSVWSHYGSR